MIDFDFEFDGDPEKLQDGGDRVKPGKGMAIITEWEEYSARSKGKAHAVRLEIVAWSDPSSVGMSHTEQIYHEDKSGKGFPMKRMTTLSMAAGLFTPADVKAWRQAGAKPSVNMQSLVGRPICVCLAEEPDKDNPGKKYIRVGNIGLGFYHIDDPRVQDWPKNQTVFNSKINLVGRYAPGETKAAKQRGSSSPASQQQQSPSIFDDDAPF